jgi:hydrogenase maturation protease
MENRIAGGNGDDAFSGGTEYPRGQPPRSSATAVRSSYSSPVSAMEKTRPPETRSLTTLVLGIGNSLRCDDGAGIQAIRDLQANHPASPDVEFMDGGTLGFTLTRPIAEADHLIVIDAANLAAAPGTVRLFQGAEMDRFLRNGKKRTTAHEAGLVDLMLMAQWTDSVRTAQRGRRPRHSRCL